MMSLPEIFGSGAEWPWAQILTLPCPHSFGLVPTLWKCWWRLISILLLKGFHWMLQSA